MIYKLNSKLKEVRRTDFIESISNMAGIDLPMVTTEVGTIGGGEEFIFNAKEKFNRRDGRESIECKRVDELYFEPLEKVIQEFENKHGTDIDTIDVSRHHGKRLRGELPIRLKENAGLKYKKIAKFPIFQDIKFHSLGRLYFDAKKRQGR